MAEVVGIIGTIVATFGVGIECCYARKQEEKLERVIDELKESNEELKKLVEEKRDNK
ncbi:MAG: hypothetical protein ACXABY_08050 [Candidatus Thorarchaeota archaeon]|jgi:hypothetical protein